MVERVFSIERIPVRVGQPSGATFRRYIRNGAGVVLARLDSDRVEHLQSVCELSLQIIHYSLLAKEGWPLCRQIILAVAPRMEQLGYRAEWIHLLEASVSWARAEQDTVAEAEMCRILGQMKRLLDSYALAESWLEDSVAAFRLCGDARNVAVALNQLGRVRHLQYRYADAIVCVSEALTLLDTDDGERAESHYVLGMVALDQRRWADAEDQHKLALNFRLRAGYQRTIGWSYQNLGLVCLMQSIYGERDRLLEADEWLRLAADLLECVSDSYHLALTQNNLASVQVRLGHYHKALKPYQEASAALRSLGAQRPLAQTYNNLGLLYLRLGEPERAEDAFRDGVAVYISLGDHQSRLNTQHGIVLALLEQKRFAEAAELCERSLSEIDRLQSVPEEYEEKRKWYTESLQKAWQGIV